MLDRRTFLKHSAGTLVSAGTWAGLPGSAYGQSATPLNFVFILVDDMGWTDLACYGSHFYETPNIDRLAASGMRFTNAYAACTVCSPTRASILTGKYPARLHLTDWIAGHKRPKAKLRVPDFNLQLPLEETTLAEILKPLGYVSASVGKWHLGEEPFYPEHQGFDVNIAGSGRGQPHKGYFSPYQIPTLTDGAEGEYLTDRLADEAVRFIETHRERPFFLYWPHFAVHTPIQAKQELIALYEAKVDPAQKQKNPAYAAMIHSVDDAVGRVLDTLERMQIADRTVVFFMSDNGGLVLNHVTDNSPLRAGKGSAYEGGIRTPMIVRWPGKTIPGSTCEVSVISTDFYPTILAMVGAPNQSQNTCDGVDLSPLLTNSGSIDREYLYWHYPHYHPGGATPYGAIRHGNFKLIEFYEDGSLELYNLKEDIGETHNLVETHPDIVRSLHTELSEWRKRVDAQMPTENPEYDPNASQ